MARKTAAQIKVVADQHAEASNRIAMKMFADVKNGADSSGGTSSFRTNNLFYSAGNCGRDFRKEQHF
jgi:hypothetical protein